MMCHALSALRRRVMPHDEAAMLREGADAKFESDHSSALLLGGSCVPAREKLPAAPNAELLLGCSYCYSGCGISVAGPARVGDRFHRRRDGAELLAKPCHILGAFRPGVAF